MAERFEDMREKTFGAQCLFSGPAIWFITFQAYTFRSAGCAIESASDAKLTPGRGPERYRRA